MEHIFPMISSRCSLKCPENLGTNAMQQLPKILDALNNMARRSRAQLERKGMLLSGQMHREELPKRNGILKSRQSPNASQLRALNEFWKAYHNTFSCGDSQGVVNRLTNARNLQRTCEIFPNNRRLCCREYCKDGIYSPQKSLSYLDTFPRDEVSLPSLQALLVKHLRKFRCSPQEHQILAELLHLRTVLYTPFHKLLRKRPKEFVLPLPRRVSRAIGHQMRSKSLTSLQSVRELPNSEYRRKWLKFESRPSSSFTRLNHGTNNGSSDTSAVISPSLARKYSCSLAIPKGWAFITYPDYWEDISFQGTIGGRRLVSWEKGTRFPEMGLDQSEEFRLRREMGRQQMVQNRIRGIRSRRSRHYDDTNNEDDSHDEEEPSSAPRRRPSFFHVPQQPFPTRFVPCRASTSGSRRRFSWSWLKLRRPSISSSISRRTESLANFDPDNEDVLIQRILEGRRRAALRAERRKRVKMCLMTFISYMSCGIVPCLLKRKYCFGLRRRSPFRTATYSPRERWIRFRSQCDTRPSENRTMR